MDEMKVFIVNLGMYNEGKETGAWFTLPVDFETVKEQIGLNGNHEEYAIHDYELPFEIDEYETIERLNHLAGLAQLFDGSGYEEDIKEMMRTWGISFEELAEHEEDIICYLNCDDDEDVARVFIEENGVLNRIPTDLQMYFDYAAYGRNLGITHSFAYGKSNIYEMGW